MKTTLKRIAAPKTWPIDRKAEKYVTRPRPKGQPLAFTLPMTVVLRDLLGLVDTDRQAKRAMREHDVRVNGKRVYQQDDALGFMDVLTIGKDAYVLTIDGKGRLAMEETKDAETIQKVTDKTHVKGGKVQLNCMGGINLLVDKDEYKTGDSVVVKDGKVVKHLGFGKGAAVVVIGGHHMGTRGEIEKVEGNTCTVKADGETFQTTKENTYVLG